MSDKEWEKLATLLQKVVAEPGTWEEKKEKLAARMEMEGAFDALEEIANWFTQG